MSKLEIAKYKHGYFREGRNKNFKLITCKDKTF